MRLGEKKLIHIRKSRESKKKFSAFLIVLLFVSICAFSAIYFLENVRPVMISLAETEAQHIAQRAANDAILKMFAKNGVSYSDVVVFEKGEDGKIVAAKSNLEGVNRLKAELTTMIQDYIAEIDTAEITIPLGTVMGTDILAGIGPRFSVDFVPYGVTEVDFISNFENAGINQTRLTVDLSVKTDVGLVMPTASAGASVETTVPVIQTVIVGDVPDSYTNVERDGYEFEDDVLELAE